MRIEQLRYMLEVAKCHSVSIAANNLYISQSTISDAIKKLEEELAIPLFERTKSGMYLTKAGEKIIQKAEAVGDDIHDIYRIAAEEKQNTVNLLKEQLNIYTTFSLEYNKLFLTLKEFQQIYPAVRIRILEESYTEIIHKIQSGIADIGIVACSSENVLILSTQDLQYEVLSTENFYVLVRKDSKLAHKSSISLKEVTKYPLTIFCFNDLAEGISNSIILEDEKIQNTFQTNSMQLLQNHIILYDTVGFILGETTLRNINVHPELIPIKISDKMKIKLYLVYKEDSGKIKLIRSFWEILKKYF